MAKRVEPRGEDSFEAGRISTAFESLSQRNTKPRKVIAEKLKELAEERKSFTGDDLWREVRRKGSRIGRATVFRSIEQLVAMEVLDRIDFSDGSHRFFVCGDRRHHHHLACIHCHRVVEFEYCLPGAVITSIGRQERFSIEDHALTLFGRCEDCK